VKKYIGRLAPSPTGALHLGNVRTFMIAWLRARSQNGRVIMRMEDLDHPRDKPGAANELIKTLQWLGFDWDEEYVQSERKELYREATEKLHSSGFIYPCTCSRKDVENAQSAPHEGDQLFYPGICRNKFKSWQEAQNTLPEIRTPCWRFKVPENTIVSFTDNFAGPYSMNVSQSLGDFPLARDEGGAGYTLAAVLDDALSSVTEVVRGDDLLPATPAQILVCKALGFREPEYFHVPLVVGPDGRRLAKRHGDTRVDYFKNQGYSAKEIIGRLAHSCGLSDGSPTSLGDLIKGFSPNLIPHTRFITSEKTFFA
jgi:glutamyl-tRNA synthetase